MDFYLAYKTWHEKFYGRPFAITREEWAKWCKQTGPVHRVCSCQEDQEQADSQFDIETERREGWGYE